MIRTITAINYLGESLYLDLARPKLSGFAVKSITGLGPAKASINTTTVATNDGATFNFARKETRNIVINLGFNFFTSPEEGRHITYQYFPVKQPITLIVETDDRLGMITGYVESNEPDIFSKDEGCSISIICPDPNFYMANGGGTQSVVFSGMVGQFEFPFENDSLSEPTMEFGTVLNKADNIINYEGDSEIGITISMHAKGTVNGITIYNANTRELMKINTDKLESLTGSTMISGDDIIITTTKNAKSAILLRNGETTNILNCIERPITWFTLSKGKNVFAYTADNGSSNLEFKIDFNTIYEGM